MNNLGRTRSEIFVSSLCQNAFLKLWTHPNPLGKNGNELCDCIVVCGFEVIIISVKEIKYRDTGNKVGWERWQRAAIHKSAKQIYGAEKWIQTVEKFQRSDGREIILPPTSLRKIHRISISLGARGEVPLFWGDLGKGFVHVFDEYSLAYAFCELDTISDFIQYLLAVESLVDRGIKFLFSGGGVEDLLAMYLANGDTFGLVTENGAWPDKVIISGNLWKTYMELEEYKEKRKEFEISYVWDKMIDYFTYDLLSGGIFNMFSKDVTEDEEALIAMARQPRNYRLILAESLIEFLDPLSTKIASRAIVGANDTAFVFLSGDTIDRESRAQELFLRCIVVRANCKNIRTVVGIATDRKVDGKIEYSSDIVYIDMPELAEPTILKAAKIQTELGYFRNTKWPR